jgi:Uma2 family endonuclease
VVVVEVQRKRDPNKRLSWPAYVALLRVRFRSQVHLLVVAPDHAVARWCRQPIALGNGAIFTPTVLSSAEIVPDWVCEILSTNRNRDLVDKRRILHSFAVPHNWIMDLEEPLLTVLRYHPDGSSSSRAPGRASALVSSPSTPSSSTWCGFSATLHSHDTMAAGWLSNGVSCNSLPAARGSVLVAYLARARPAR